MAWNMGENLFLDEKDKEGNQIHLQEVVRLLGVNVKNNLTWKEHLLTGEKAVIPNVRRKIGALYLVS